MVKILSCIIILLKCIIQTPIPNSNVIAIPIQANVTCPKVSKVVHDFDDFFVGLKQNLKAYNNVKNPRLTMKR
jgi:hypothetical protein